MTDGTQNACSMLYGACARAAQAIGFVRIQTYILESELGTSLRATGWTDMGGPAGGGQWVRASRRSRRSDQPTTMKRRYAKVLNVRPDVAVSESENDSRIELFATQGRTP